MKVNGRNVYQSKIVALALKSALVFCSLYASNIFADAAPSQDVRLCLGPLKGAIDRSFSARFSSELTKKALNLNQLYFSAYLNVPLRYLDQKKAHAEFGVWVERGHPLQALYQIYAESIKEDSKDPERLQLYRYVEAVGGLYRYCAGIDALNAQDSLQAVQPTTSNLLLQFDEIKKPVAQRLNDILPWYYSNQKRALVLIRKELSLMVRSDLQVNSKSSQSTRMEQALWSISEPKIFDFYVNLYVSTKNYEELFQYLDHILQTSKTETGKYLEQKSQKLHGRVYCSSLKSGLGHEESLFIAALSSSLITTEQRYCQGEVTGYCAISVLNRLAQLPPGSERYKFDYSKISIMKQHFDTQLQNIKDSDENFSGLARLLSRLESTLSEKRCQ